MKKFCALFFLAAMIFAGCGEKDDAIVENPNSLGETPGQPSEIPDETPTLIIGTEKFTFPAEGGSVRIPFEVNVDWEASIKYEAGNSEWLTLTPESGEAGNIELTVVAETNSATEQRSAVVHILYGGKLYEIFIIQCAGTSDPVLTPVLIIENTDYTVADKGGAVQIPFEVNVDWEASIKYEAGDSGWLTLTPESGEAGKVVLTITADANFTTAQRKAFVRILYGGQSCELLVIQLELNENMNITDAFDPLFAQALQRRGYIPNASYILYREVRNITQIDVSWAGIITSLQGIEFFSALTGLNCEGNQLASLDVSKNTSLTGLNCVGNQLASLDVSGCTALTWVGCYSNQLTSLDVSGCTALTELDCNSNRLTSLDVSGCTALTVLHCYCNQLTSLDVSGCTALTALNCYWNQLTSLDVSGCTALTWVGCWHNQLTSLDISKNTALTGLGCNFNPGNGSVFYVMAWFDKKSIPSSGGFTSQSWTYNDHTIYIQYLKIR